jgi:hypothetical protein
MLGDILVLNLDCLLNQHTLQYLSRVRAAGDRRATAESLKDSLINFASLFVHLYLQFHDVAASWRPDQTSPHVWILLVKRADISRVFVVVQDIFVVGKHSDWFLNKKS